MEPDYLIRTVAKGRFQIAKFEMIKAPTQIYYIIQGKIWWCTCPGNRSHGSCKHIGFVQRWISLGERELNQLK